MEIPRYGLRPLWQRYIAVAVYLGISAALVQILAALYFSLTSSVELELKRQNLPFRFLMQTVIIQMCAFLLPAPLLLKFTNGRAFTFSRAPAKDILLCCSLIFASLVFFSALYHHMGIEPRQLGFLDGKDILNHKAAFIAVTAIAVPGYEEWVFRGLIFGVLVSGVTEAHKIWFAGFFSALIFTASHFEGKHSLSALPPILVMAAIFQYCTWRSQSLWPAVCGHAMQNFLSSLAFFVKFAAEVEK